jgi:hypothetical protein
MLGRLTHTFREDYLDEDNVRRASSELVLHADVVTKEAKRSMQDEAKKFQRKTRDLIDRKHQMLREFHRESEMALAGVQARMKEAFDYHEGAYVAALKEHQRMVTENTVTEDTLKKEMLIAASAHAESIKKMKAHPPLFIDDTRNQLQIRVAEAEEKADDLQRKLQAMAGIQRELEARGEELDKLRKSTQDLNEQLRKVSSAQGLKEKEAQADNTIMVALRKKLEAANGEIESLKRKRDASISPQRQVTSILKRQVPGQNAPSSSAQPTPKKSRNRKERWDTLPTSVTPRQTPTSVNRDGVKGKGGHVSPPKARDPVLHGSLSSVRRKQDISQDIEESAKTLGFVRSDFSLVFCRSKLEDQVAVTRKALAYVEILVTSTCAHLLKSAKIGNNPVQAYLDTLSLAQVFALKEDVDDALDQCEDSSRCMAVYQGGDDLRQRVRAQCFTEGGTPLRPHKQDDARKNLHARLGCHNLQHIPIGFYYAKWSEKLGFYMARGGKQDRSLSSASKTRTPTPSPVRSPRPIKALNIPPLAAAEDLDISIDSIDDSIDITLRIDQLRSQRTAIFNDTSDGKLTKKDRAVFWYREKRRDAWKAVASETMLNEAEWNDRYDQEELEKVRVSMEELENILEVDQQQANYGDGPAGQGRK